MTTHDFELDLTTHPDDGLVRFRLRNQDDQHLAAHQVRLAEHGAALWEGLFDTRSHVRRYAGGTRFTERRATAEDLLERIGVFLGEEVLGREVMDALSPGHHHRTLLVQLPETADDKDDKNVLAAAFARVPWEIARPAAGEESLMQRNLVVRAVTPESGDAARLRVATSPGEGETLRVLLVFAEAPGSRPLAMRLEREQLLALFHDAVMPRRKVAVDVLCHGVTRDRLREQVRSAKGYHLVHWSGHGHHDLLELPGAAGKPDYLSGEDLLRLFAEAGGFIPHLVFLSACLSGTLVSVRDQATLRAALSDPEAGIRRVEAPELARLLEETPGYTGTALALLRAGVPQVVAMRYEVGDAYARDLAALFYQGILADDVPASTASALALAHNERLLLVLDNFENQLEEVAGEAGYACDDPEWDQLLAALAERLPETGSRLLITSRHRLACLAAEAKALWIQLGPLPMGEAVLFLQGSEALRRLAFGDEDGRTLALRLLEVSRGHPLILTRLGTLADDREALGRALAELEAKGLDRMPEVFAERLSEAERERERVYLEDVAVGSVDLLLERASPSTRRLLWLVTLASEPVAQGLIEVVWKEGPSEAPPLAPLLAELTDSGLLAVEAPSPEAGEESSAVYGFHELVRERVAARMAAHPEEKGGRTEEEVWEAYGVRYGATFQALMNSGEPGSREQAAEAGRRGLSYLVRARAFGRLGSFAGDLVISTRDPRLLRGVIAELEGVADQVPAGQDRWRMRTYLADAFRNVGRPDAALGLYEQAASEAEEAGHWSDVGAICQNWANALRNVGQLDGAKATFLRSAEADQKAGSPRVDVVGSELEAFRIDVMQGHAERALPEIESRLAEIRNWWQRHRAGEPVAEAPEPVVLGRALVSGLDIAEKTNRALERWEDCLELLEEEEETKRTLGEGKHERAGTRFNQYHPLLRLGRLDDAQRVLEGCLAVYREFDDLTRQARALSALADLWDQRGDRVQAVALERQALTLRNGLPDLTDRSISHGNLSIGLNRSGAAEESARHLLAAIVYAFVANHRQHLSLYLNNLAISIRQADGQYELPRLAELLERPEFDALKQVLDAAGVGVEELQAGIAGLVEEVGQGVKG